ncbi:MAG: UvrD-helicase domain-containing protein, partial [Verrucomicrobiota bacterium]|nr:UvrD-helicase domain-containing protein [Verrucomicrobiota bacterium]
MKPLYPDVHASGFPLPGWHLVEAGAGTGKTHAIQTLYLRLIVESGLQVKQIVVVTFTEAATRELRDRLRAILHKTQLFMQSVLDRADPDADRIGAILRLEPCRPWAARSGHADHERAARVRRALLDFDEAAISTIHGFCNGILKEFAFECGQSFEVEVAGDQDALVRDACVDWWRRNMHDPTPLLGLLLERGEIRLGLLLECARKVVAKCLGANNLRPAPVSYDEAVRDLAERMPALRAALDALLRHECLAEPQRFEPSKGAERFLSALRKLRAALAAEPQPRELAEAALAALDAIVGEKGKIGWKTREPWSLPDDSAVAGFEASVSAKRNFTLSDLSPALIGELEAARDLLVGLIGHAALEIRARHEADKRDRGFITFDDMLISARQALSHPEAGPRLAAELRAVYRAALIDEFQDTDPIQHEIFRTLFPEEEFPVFLVGDPKQAIYAFRSGDIYTYYAAAARIPGERQFTLDTNYRSERALVDGVNLVFADRPDSGTFLNSAIRYAGALCARGKPPADSLLLNGSPDPAPFKIWFYDKPVHSRPPGEDSPEALRLYADLAEEVARLLHDDTVRLGGRRLKPSDFAVLVTTHREAALIKRELQSARNVPAVVQSAGSVFDSLEAEDLLLLLTAMAEPGNSLAVRSALATELFHYNREEPRVLAAGG